MQVATLAVVLGTLLSAAHAAEAQPTIYRCAGEGGAVYSDRPCGAKADKHEVDGSRVSVYSAQPIAKRTSAATSIKRPKASRANPRRAADPAQRRAQCAKLDQKLRDVRTRMRTGYGVEEGERLKARERLLKQQRQAQKCR